MVVIAGMPLVDTLHAPLAAPAVLKSSLTANGIESVAIDLNIEVLAKVKSHPEQENIRKFFLKQQAEDWVVEQISSILHYCAKRILDHNPSLIAVSLLTYECQIFTSWLCLVLKELAPDIPIVAGGPGIKYQIANYDDHWRHKARDRGLINDWISGDGDQSLVEYAKGNKDYPGINNDNWLPSDLNSLPYPDWSDYNFYWYSQSYMPVVDSKGCVRNCEFCDVIEYWQKFQSRTADNIFEEMLHANTVYGSTMFDFRSSLSNGNLKEFKKLIDLIDAYNQGKFRPEQFGFNCSFIIRKEALHPESMWQKMSNCHATLSLGVESVIPHVRKDLGKNFENPDIDWHLEMAKKYNVDLNLMIITGYPTENREDWEFTKQWFRDRQQYNNTITRLFLSPAVVLPGTGLQRAAEEYQLILTTNGADGKWYTNDISYDDRIQYHKELVSMCRDLGFRLDAY